jgi:hypothetical protein
MTQDNEFTGTWVCRHWWPSNNHDGEDTSACDVVAEQTGNRVVFQSRPDDHGTYILVRLRFEGNFARGSWSENADPNGEFAGKLYSGVMEMIVDDDKRRISGKWVGIGQDVINNKPDVFTGRWELTRKD